MIEWRTDVESMPIDGREVLIKHKYDFSQVIWYDVYDECFRDDAGQFDVTCATHWAEIAEPKDE